MKFAEFKKAGHWPTLLAAFLYFDISFMAWVALGPLIVYIVRDMNLAVDEKFTLVAIPVLAGALLRVPMGLLADLFGAKRTGIIAQLVVIAATAWVCYFGLPTKLSVEIFGLALGIGGASFAVALPQASRWYPPQYQGVVMGIAGAGNMGVVIDTMLAPSIAEHFGWQAVFGFLLIPMVLVFAFYAFAAKDAPGERKPVSLKAYGTLLRDPDSRWFMFFYSITFGGFVGLANALPLYFTVQYHVSGVTAGSLVSLIVAFGSGFRPVGGLIADRIGGIRSLSVLFAVVVTAYLVIAFMPEGPAAPTAAGWSLLTMPRIAWMSVSVLDRRAGARHGQWRGVPANSAPVPPGHRPDDRAGRLRRRRRRLLPGADTRHRQGRHRRLRRRLRVFRGAGIAWLYRTCHGQGPVAHDMGRGLRGARLTTRVSSLAGL